MRKFTILATIIAFVGCSQYSEKLDIIISTPTNNPNEFYASMPECNTRTYVEDNKYLRWNADDEITVFAGNSYNGHWQFAGEDGANSGKFNEIYEGGFVTGTPLDLTANYAIYPYDENITITEAGVVSLTLPAVQEYNHTYANSFGAGANTMMAVTQNTSDNFLSFKNLCGYLKLKFYGENVTVKSVTVKGNNGEKIAGSATVSMAYGSEPTITMGDDATDTITIDCGEGVALSNDAANPTTFWVVIPEITFEGGITIEVTDINNQTFSKHTTNAVPIENNLIQPMALLEVECVPVGPANNEIWYTNGSTTNAITPYKTNVFGANIISNTYDAEKECWVIKFDGNVASIGNNAFSHCTRLISVTIPDSVTTIGEYAFYACSNLTSVNIPNGVTSIEPLTFCECSSLTSIIIPDSVTYIGNMAFKDCTLLQSVTIGKGVTSIGYSIFSDCTSLKSVTIPDSVTSIGNSTFYNCSSLTSITIPNGVTSIGEYAFTGCTSLTSITIPDSVTSIGVSAFFDCTSLTSVTIPDGVTSIEDHVFCYCTSLKYVTIPNRITKIGEWAFNGCENLTSVAIPDGVKSIGEYAFQGCESLTSITIPNSVTTIGKCAFNMCSGMPSFKGKFASSDCRCLIIDGVLISFAIGSGLTEYTIPDSVTRIEERAFTGCKSLTSITIPNSVTSIGDYAFYDCCNLTSVYCEAITPPSLGIRVFQHSALGYHEIIDCDIYVPTEAVYDYESASGWSSHDIFGYLFEKNKIWYTATSKVKPYDSNYFGSSIKSNEWNSTTGKGIITFYGDVTKIGENAFRECTSLESITIPHSVTAIGPSAFYYCTGLYSVTMPDSLTLISYNAFLTCTILRSVTIPDGVTAIGNSAFSSCSRLIAVYCKATTPPSLGSNVFKNNATGRKIYVPAESIEAYKRAEGWSSYASDIVGYDFDKDEIVKGDGSYTITLNSAWRKSTSVSNPDSSLYDGVYESYSNYNVHDKSAWMYIDIEGYTEFTIYVRSYAESNYDYVTVYNLDSTSSAKMTTKGNQQSGTSISNYTPVTFSNIGGGLHRIAIEYKKDGSQNSNSDRGYVLIPKY